MFHPKNLDPYISMKKKKLEKDNEMVIINFYLIINYIYNIIFNFFNDKIHMVCEEESGEGQELYEGEVQSDTT